MSLPNDLFEGTVACAMVLRAHQPHAQSPQPTWFGYWKDDGFMKTKDRGRIDLRHRRPGIRDQWLAAFHSRAQVPGQSVMRQVTADDEWCAEAYMETDYSSLTEEDLALAMRKYALHTLLHQIGEEPTSSSLDANGGTEKPTVHPPDEPV
jgi:hypothetical protein